MRMNQTPPRGKEKQVSQENQVNPPKAVRVPEAIHRALMDHLKRVSTALNQILVMEGTPPEVARLWVISNKEMEILTPKVNLLKAKVFLTDQEMNLAANEMAHRIVSLGREVMLIEKLENKPTPRGRIAQPLENLANSPVLGQMAAEKMASNLEALKAGMQAMGTSFKIPPNLPQGMVTATSNGETITLATDLVTDPNFRITSQQKREILKEALTELDRKMTGRQLTPNLTEQIASQVDQLMEILDSPAAKMHLEIRDLGDLLGTLLRMELILPTAQQEVKMLLVQNRPIFLKHLHTLNRQLEMKEMAEQHRVYPLLMRQTSHRSETSSMETWKEDFDRTPNLFLTTVPLKMWWS